jgi:Lon protease-like protein
MSDNHPKEASLRDHARSFEDALGTAIPIFPLPQVVLFPAAELPLHIFEPRYRAMLAHALSAHGALAIAHIIGGEDEHGRPRIAPIAGGGIVIEHQPLPDGRSNIVLLGQARLRLDELDPDDSRPFRMARAVKLEDLPVSVRQNDRTALVAAATMFAAEVKKHDPSFSFRMPSVSDGLDRLDASHLADLCAFQLVVDAGARQAILNELDPRTRVEMVLSQLALQHGAMINSDKSRVTVLN